MRLAIVCNHRYRCSSRVAMLDLFVPSQLRCCSATKFRDLHIKGSATKKERKDLCFIMKTSSILCGTGRIWQSCGALDDVIVHRLGLGLFCFRRTDVALICLVDIFVSILRSRFGPERIVLCGISCCRCLEFLRTENLFQTSSWRNGTGRGSFPWVWTCE